MRSPSSASAAYEFLPAARGTFQSTRSGAKSGFWDSIVQGAAQDGGLLVPEEFPRLSPHWIKESLPTLSPAAIGATLLRGYIPDGEIPDEDLREMLEHALNFELPLEELDASTFILRLDRGPTASFKDIAARVLAILMERFSARHGTPINLLVATSGDTGVAIQNAFKGRKGLTVTVLYPAHAVSPVQEQQMLDAPLQEDAGNIQTLPMEGTFDDAQNISKILQSLRGVHRLEEGEQRPAIEAVRKEIRDKLKEDLKEQDILDLASSVDELNLSSANSINIWRLLPQMTQYFTGYAAMVREGKIQAGQDVVFAVPSGNLGHLMAGIYAKEAGLPIKRFVAGTNANNIFAYVIGKGCIKHKGFVNTDSPAMDILDPSNLERLLRYAAQKTDCSGTIDFPQMKFDIKKLDDEIRVIRTELDAMNGASDQDDAHKKFKAIGARPGIPLAKYGVTPAMLTFLQELIWAEDIRDGDEVLETMGEIYKNSAKTLEPHGTTALLATECSRKNRQGIGVDDFVIVFETAHPDKFPAALDAAKVLVSPESKHPELERILNRPTAARPPVITGIRAVAQSMRTLVMAQQATE